MDLYLHQKAKDHAWLLCLSLTLIYMSGKEISSDSDRQQWSIGLYSLSKCSVNE